MVGHKRVKAMATVVAVRGHPGDLPPPGGGPTRSVDAVRVYEVDILDPKGRTLRTTVWEESRFVYPVGSRLPVDVSFSSGEASLDRHAMAQWTLQQMPDTQSAASGGDPTWVPADPSSPAGMASSFGVAGGVSLAQLIDARGRMAALDPARVAELQQLADVLRTGDPAAKQAARDRLRQLTNEIGQQARAAVLDQLAPGAGQVPQGAAEQRLARLEELRAKGVVTEEEYREQRQRIIEAI